MHVVEEQPSDRLIDDPDAGQEQQTGFDEGGEVLYLAVAVLMVGVGRFIGDSHRKEVMAAATRSSPECAASESIPRLPVVVPTRAFRKVTARAAKTEFKATAFFSSRIWLWVAVSVISLDYSRQTLERLIVRSTFVYKLSRPWKYRMCYDFRIHLLRP